MKIRASSSLVRCTIKKGNTLVLSFFILQAMQLTRYNYYTNKLGLVGVNYSKILAHSSRGEHRSPVKKCDTYGIFVLFSDYKFIIST